MKKVKLYAGCWGVTRDSRVVGPFRENAAGTYYVCGGWIVDEDGSVMGFEENPMLHVFPSRSEAEAWVNRKPWWRRFYDWAARRDRN